MREIWRRSDHVIVLPDQEDNDDDDEQVGEDGEDDDPDYKPSEVRNTLNLKSD